MSVTEKLFDHIAEAHATGYASELPQSIVGALHVVAEHVEGLEAGFQRAADAIGSQIDAFLEKRVEGLVNAKVQQLLAARAAAPVDAPKPAPVVPPATPAAIEPVKPASVEAPIATSAEPAPLA